MIPEYDVVHQGAGRLGRSQPDSGGFATPTEAGAFLNVSKAMIHKLIAKGEIPSSRFGRCVRIPWKFLKALAEGGGEGR